ncbi:MAG: hypothetical protein ACXADS_14990 [Candidatus Thorarchaeota archaeon]|jgi:hypothetical protein
MFIDDLSVVLKGQKSMATKWSVQLRGLLQFIYNSKTMSKSGSVARSDSINSVILDLYRYHFF